MIAFPAGDMNALVVEALTHHTLGFTPPIHWRNIDEIDPFFDRGLDSLDRFLSGRLAPNASNTTATKGEWADGP